MLLMQVKPARNPPSQKHVLADLADGVKYATGMKSLSAVLGLLAAASLAATPQMVLLPQFVTHLHGDSRTQGFLTGAVAIGGASGRIRLAGARAWWG